MVETTIKNSLCFTFAVSEVKFLTMGAKYFIVYEGGLVFERNETIGPLTRKG